MDAVVKRKYLPLLGIELEPSLKPIMLLTERSVREGRGYVKKRKRKNDSAEIKRSTKHVITYVGTELSEVSEGYKCRKTYLKGEKNGDQG
jgi:hypothetical protein